MRLFGHIYHSKREFKEDFFLLGKSLDFEETVQYSVFSVVKCFQVYRFTTFWIKWNFGLLLSLDQPPAARISASDKYFFSALDKYFVSGSDKYFPSENFQDGLLLRTDARLCSPLSAR